MIINLKLNQFYKEGTKMRCTKVVIFREHIKNNILQVKKNLQKNTKICIAVKADGYGCGAIETAKIAEEENIDYLAIATISR
jgi:alanine racemase